MERIETIFLAVYSCALSGRKTEGDLSLQDAREWKQLMHLADIHHVYPMLYEAIYDTAAAPDASIKEAIGKHAVDLTVHQAKMSAEFLRLYGFLGDKGLHPAVMKGIVCRSLYPQPEQRWSTDEDLLIPGEMFEKYNRAFQEYGLAIAGDGQNISEASEVSYYNGHIYIELHKSAFPPESKAYGELNSFFEDSLNHTVTEVIYGIPITTLGYTDHLLYLLCHCYKHFLNCGIGIRQVSDILLYSLAYSEKIDWEHIKACCREAGMFEFCCAVYKIGDIYLLPERIPDELKAIWPFSDIDEKPLLEDIMKGGIYGTSSRDRLHSSNITLNAMSKSNKGEMAGVFDNTLLSTLFPSFRYMKQRYSYISRFPFLLPAGWIHRIAAYGYESVLHRSSGSSAAEALRIGNERLELMREYRILKDKKAQPASGSFRKKLYEKMKGVYKRSHTGIFAPILSPIFLKICDIEYVLFNIKWFIQGARRPSAQDVRLVKKNVTFIFKSFERQKLAAGLCRNISRMYPGVQIIVADDSLEPLQSDLENVQIIHLPFNSGLGPGLHAALAKVRTPYVVRLDDDELLTLRTKVHRELRYLHNHPELDIIGFGHITAIRCRSPLANFREYYEQPMSAAPKPLKIPHMTKLDENHIVLGKVANIYLARTEKLREIGFDPNIRIIDHNDFFMRAAGNAVAAAALDTVVFHRHDPYDRAYRKYRSDFKKDKMYLRLNRQDHWKNKQSKEETDE